MKPTQLILPALLLLLVGCGREEGKPRGDLPGAGGGRQAETVSLADARRGFQTKLARRESAGEPVAQPPTRLFRTVRYESPAGKLGAYLSVTPADGKKRPAIVWVTGGDCNTIDDGVWKAAPRNNDQTAGAFRKAGIVMLFPSLRGGNDNPGVKEGFFGEVDDVLAAADFLGKQPGVDPDRVYLGGHSTGGTLALLAAEYPGRFRAVFPFGPVDDVGGYGPEFCPFNLADRRELELRAPGRWLNAVTSPTFVFEGTEQPGNAPVLRSLARASTNPKVHIHPVRGANHFSILAPVTELIAQKILRDEGPETNISFTEEELNKLFGK
jgi:acetyl esterase/lipase